jgi:hypothetical protein
LPPNVDSFDQVVTEKKSFLEINQSEIRIGTKCAIFIEELQKMLATIF